VVFAFGPFRVEMGPGTVADRVTNAATCSGQLESLAVSLDIGHIDVDEAVKRPIQ
jgi:hypothetical protein